MLGEEPLMRAPEQARRLQARRLRYSPDVVAALRRSTMSMVLAWTFFRDSAEGRSSPAFPPAHAFLPEPG
jgi:hypothetical protein